MLRRRFRRHAGVVKVVRCAAERVDLEFTQFLLAQLLEEPIDYETALDAALGVQDQDDFVDGAGHGEFEDLVADSHVCGAVVEGPLDEALDHIKQNTGCAVVCAAHGSLEEGDHPDGEEEPERRGEDEDALCDEEDHVVEDGEEVAGGGEELVVEAGGPGPNGGDDGEDGGEEVDEGDEVGAEELPGRSGHEAEDRGKAAAKKLTFKTKGFESATVT
ncbi:hypothetical protein V490_03826 [Pseudogymnoascus sp. VKM F-3557]|nr:hypothetical protein V490_03826 [Pseudogymnoascus sp. VKM F-3557]